MLTFKDIAMIGNDRQHILANWRQTNSSGLANKESDAFSSVGFNEVDHLKHFAAVTSTEPCKSPASQLCPYSAIEGQLHLHVVGCVNTSIWIAA